MRGSFIFHDFEQNSAANVFLSSYQETLIDTNILKMRYYLPTSPLGQDMTQGQFLSGV